MKYKRPKTRGELLSSLKENIKCEVISSNAEITSIILDGWLNFANQYKVTPSPNDGWSIYEKLKI